MTIREIEALTENEVKEMTTDVINYKGYNVYFVDLGGYFGYSRLVFKNGFHIHYANDYELHHPSAKGNKEVLRKDFESGMKHKLFEEDDMKQISSYDDYNEKNYWIRNYFPMEFKRMSMFVFEGTDEAKQLEAELQKSKWYLSQVCFCYFEDIYPLEKAKQLLETLEKAKEQTNTIEYWIAAFEHELFNHEYLINLQGNWDVFSCFGNVEYKGDTKDGLDEVVDYMKQLKMFDKMHLDAFKTAYNNYYKVAQNY